MRHLARKQFRIGSSLLDGCQLSRLRSSLALAVKRRCAHKRGGMVAKPSSGIQAPLARLHECPLKNKYQLANPPSAAVAVPALTPTKVVTTAVAITTVSV